MILIAPLKMLSTIYSVLPFLVVLKKLSTIYSVLPYIYSLIQVITNN